MPFDASLFNKNTSKDKNKDTHAILREDGTEYIEIKGEQKQKQKKPKGLILGTIAFFTVVIISILSFMGFIGIKTFSNPTQQLVFANDQKLERNAKDILFAIESYYNEYKQLPWDVTYKYDSPQTVNQEPRSIIEYKWVNELTGSEKLRNPEFLELNKLYIWASEPMVVNNLKICFKPESEEYKSKANANNNGNSVQSGGTFYCVSANE